MIRLIRILGDREQEFEDIEAFREETDKYDKWLVKGNPELKKEDLQHEVYFETGSFVYDDKTKSFMMQTNTIELFTTTALMH